MRRFIGAIAVTTFLLPAQELSIRPSGDGLELHWLRTFPPSSGVPTIIENRIFSSGNLLDWSRDSTLTFRDPVGDGLSRLKIVPNDASRFFRIEEFLTYAHRSTPSDPPAFYQQQFRNAMAGFRSSPAPDESECLSGIEWDVTQALYWDQFNTTPAEHNENLAPNDPERRITNFKLNDAERARFIQNGFVVSPRIDLIAPDPFGGHPNPVDYYYSLWTDDLPVFITADSVLDAWHETFLRMLEEVEEFVLYPKLRELVIGLENQSDLKSTWDSNDTPGAENVRQAMADLNLYLGTALRLLIDLDNGGPTGDLSSPSHWYQAARDHSDNTKSGLYGDGGRIEDMTLFTPRGHYTNSRVLTAYFQGFLWLSRAQFQIASSTPTEQSDRELRAAILLALHVRDRGLLDEWQFIESFVQTLNGQSDAMTVVEMLALLESLSLDRVTALTSDSDVTTIRKALLASNYGIQEINNGNAFVVNCNPVDYELPRALSLVGQRWTPDSWTFGKTVFPEVKNNGVAVLRRVPSGLDVAYATLGNDTALPILTNRMVDPNGVPFRDGFDYRDNLDSVRSVLDSQESTFWTEHTYGSWLYSLRALSEPIPASAPDTFRTGAWKHRIMNTQLASWTQLRHDTLLYAEQSFTPPVICEFPCGYVDPYPDLWERLSEMALQYKSLLSPLELHGTFWVEAREHFGGESPVSLQNWNSFRGLDPDVNDNQIWYLLPEPINRGTRIAAMCDHLDNFSQRCLTLETIARQQLDGLPHTNEMNEFIRDTVETFSSASCDGFRYYTGWFPNLYFKTPFSSPYNHPSAIWKPVVADVHTDSEDDCSGDPGGILHEGTGHSQFMLVAVKNADGTSCVYGGPVLSHYEFLEPLGTRLNDGAWEARVVRGEVPDPEEWKLNYLVPKE